MLNFKINLLAIKRLILGNLCLFVKIWGSTWFEYYDVCVCVHLKFFSITYYFIGTSNRNYQEVDFVMDWQKMAYRWKLWLVYSL